MSQLTQLVYVSRSTSASSAGFANTDANAGKILIQARANNRKRTLSGGLCFADGCFLQCLEGDEAILDALLLKLAADPRHCDLTVLFQKPIRQRDFADWEMKFVAIQSPMMKWLKAQGHDRFDPYQFDRKTVQGIMEFLGAAQNLDVVPATASNPIDRSGHEEDFLQ